MTLNPVRAGRYPYSSQAVVIGRREFPVQDVDGVLARFADRRSVALREYRSFVAAGFAEGSRPEFRGGGLVRSAGGWEAVVLRRPEEREAADERILGGGRFVEEVLEEQEALRKVHSRGIEEVLSQVCDAHAVDRGRLLGPSRERTWPRCAGRSSCGRMRRRGGSSALGRLAGRSHTAVSKATALARSERQVADEQ